MFDYSYYHFYKKMEQGKNACISINYYCMYKLKKIEGITNEKIVTNNKQKFPKLNAICK